MIRAEQLHVQLFPMSRLRMANKIFKNKSPHPHLEIDGGFELSQTILWYFANVKKRINRILVEPTSWSRCRRPRRLTFARCSGGTRHGRQGPRGEGRKNRAARRNQDPSRAAGFLFPPEGWVRACVCTCVPACVSGSLSRAAWELFFGPSRYDKK